MRSRIFAMGSRRLIVAAAGLCMTAFFHYRVEHGFGREIAHWRSLISHRRLAVSVSCASGLGGVCS
jgi:hypothetical protein